MSNAQREYDPLVDELPSRYVVGIDLGTTNSAVAYVDTEASPWTVVCFSTPQLVAPAQVESRDTLPSFHYQATNAEVANGAFRLTWSRESPSYAVGVLARDEGTKTPGRLIASAKSWLCHSGVDRTADLLPWQGASDVDRLSPVEVTARYLGHIRDAWNAQFPRHPLAEQEVVITLPASFDEVARELTISAAGQAELPRVALIEEPQAAFYDWVNKHADWHELVEAGQKILVCDIGGGTSDFTLIRVRASSDAGGKVQFHRVAVGEHLILGGDNLDAALAHHVEKKIAKGGKLTPQQWDVLVRSARRVKEILLADDAPEVLTMNLPGSGSKVVGGGLQAEVRRDEIQQLLVDGFLPTTTLDEQPAQRQSGFQEFGLPYAADAGITRYLAAFLTAHRSTGMDASELPAGHDPARPDVVFFNGGFFASPVLRQRLLDVLTSWFQQDATSSKWEPLVLENDRLDLAVARGAAYYGMVRRGEGVRIAANLARSYYIGVESEPPSAVCLVPGDAEAGQSVESDTTFQLTVSSPVEFPLFVSSTRLVDRPGEIVELDTGQITPLPPIRTVIRTERRKESGTVPIHLHAKLTEIGTIDLWCKEVDKDRSWRLQFDVRSATQTDLMAHQSSAEQEGFLDEKTWDRCLESLQRVFGDGGDGKPSALMRELTTVLGMSKNQWPTSLLRRVWEALMELEPGRRGSPEHEARWLNLVGFSLRPGYGFAVDDWRVAETWRMVRAKLAHSASKKEALVLWRRLSGGLSRGQQLAIAEPLLAEVRSLHRRFAGGRQRGGELSVNPAESVEIWRLLGSLELLGVPAKVRLGNQIVELLPKKKLQNVRDAMVWALGRLGHRIPVYGPLNTVVPATEATRWVESLLKLDRGEPIDLLAAMQLARLTGDRHRDIPASLREEVCDWMDSRCAAAHLIKLVREGGTLDDAEQSQVFGESLPKGLRLQ